MLIIDDCRVSKLNSSIIVISDSPFAAVLYSLINVARAFRRHQLGPLIELYHCDVNC